jgi:anti-anti-sigma regulatory factor
MQAVAARAAGAGHIIVDMRAVERVNTAGMVALCAVARLGHEAAPDLEAGWAAIRALAEDGAPFARLAIVNPYPSVCQTLARAPFSDFLAIHADLDTALATLAA